MIPKLIRVKIFGFFCMTRNKFDKESSGRIPDDISRILYLLSHCTSVAHISYERTGFLNATKRKIENNFFFFFDRNLKRANHHYGVWTSYHD